MDSNVSLIRREIDRIDGDIRRLVGELWQLLRQRMFLVGEIGECKRLARMPVRDVQREADVERLAVEHILEVSGEEERSSFLVPLVRDLFRGLMAAARAAQEGARCREEDRTETAIF